VGPAAPGCGTPRRRGGGAGRVTVILPGRLAAWLGA